MITIDFSPDERAMFTAWVRREKDRLLSIRALAREILIPQVTGTLESISEDLDFSYRLKNAVEAKRDAPLVLAEDDVDRLLGCAQANQYADRSEFWASVESRIKAVLVEE
jgi:hypothetical protein